MNWNSIVENLKNKGLFTKKRLTC